MRIPDRVSASKNKGRQGKTTTDTKIESQNPQQHHHTHESRTHNEPTVVVSASLARRVRQTGRAIFVLAFRWCCAVFERRTTVNEGPDQAGDSLQKEKEDEEEKDAEDHGLHMPSLQHVRIVVVQRH